MQFGLTIFPTDYSIEPVELARIAEERGFESLWFPEHTHIPASRRTPYPAGGELPREYSHLSTRSSPSRPRPRSPSASCSAPGSA